MSSIQGKGGPKDVTLDQNGTYWIKMGETSQFGRALQRSMDHSKRVPIEGVLLNMGGHRRWQNQSSSMGKEDCQWLELIHEQLAFPL